MARVKYLFFIFLSFLLLGNCNYIYANAVNPAISDYFSVRKSDATKLLKSVKPDQSTIITNSSFNEENDYLNDVEDDESLISARKYVLQSKHFLLLRYIFILNFLCILLKNHLPNRRHFYYRVSYKYILLRSLRI
ncbi:MAG: hypothetical protein EOP42_08420 [Sphingobacteriaceae bacterium]|nr:MAG: hypothetical protein EOP42_08420 [Sphingobacteriaceae bacterium]